MKSLIEKNLNIVTPESLHETIEKSKFFKFKRAELRTFVIENYKQTTFSLDMEESSFIDSVNHWQKNCLVVLCIQIENTRKFLNEMIISLS